MAQLSLSVQWSLSIEEVFYLTFPILCILCRREGFLLCVWSIAILIGPIWRAAHQGSEYLELNSYLSCFDGIAFGCCAAVIRKHVYWTPNTARLICVAVATLMAWFYLTQWIGHSAVYGVTLMALGTAILLLAQSHLPQRAFRLTAPLRFIGRLSYELYLFHLIMRAHYEPFGHPPPSRAMQSSPFWSPIGCCQSCWHSRSAVSTPNL
jgi:peptidoglycan/LPS O-acetylase OafA/YrhL